MAANIPKVEPYLMRRAAGHPRYGPEESPAIFGKKWHTKFQKLFDDFYNTIDRRNRATLNSPFDTQGFCSLAVDLVLTFNFEAVMLRFEAEDLPSQYAVGQTPKKSPFEMVEIAVSGTNTILSNWTRLRDGEVIGGATWRNMSLSGRLGIESILAKVDNAVKAGRWNMTVDEQFVQQMNTWTPEKRAEMLEKLGPEEFAKQEAIGKDMAKPEEERYTKPSYSRAGLPKWF